MVDTFQTTLPLPSALAASGSNAALVTFLLYSAAVLGLAVLSHRLLARRSFLAEYFLGSRDLGMWAFMLTFAATSASAGSFGGFPALVYTHGWVLALWIAGYMTVPLISMGLLGKRLNQLARRADAITVPDFLHARFGHSSVSVLATIIIVCLLMFYLISQFKLASLILQILLEDVPLWQWSVSWVGFGTRNISGLAEVDPGYLFGLFVFSLMVIFYTSFGGFRAVVWTDMLQGLVMIVGVAVMVCLVLFQVNGLSSATQELARMTPPRLGNVMLEVDTPADEEIRIPSETWIQLTTESSARLIRTNEAALIHPGESASISVKAVEITTPSEKERALNLIATAPETLLPEHIHAHLEDFDDYAFGAGQPGVYVSAPGPSPTDFGGFLSISMSISFFLLWTMGGSGQPGNMVRLMAFDRVRTLKRGMALLTVYYGIIYVSIVIIFCCGRILVPGLDQTPDRIMPVLSLTVAQSAGIPWLAGLLIAAPFAAAMSTVDSFMLMISSSLIRDIYQRSINPRVTEDHVKRLSQYCTMIVGMIVMVAAINPPQFLQMLIVFTAGGLSAVFLMPMLMALYWSRFNVAGALGGMLGGFFSYVTLYILGYLQYGETKPIRPLSMDPLIWGFLASAAIGYALTLSTRPPERAIVERFFGKRES